MYDLMCILSALGLDAAAFIYFASPQGQSSITKPPKPLMHAVKLEISPSR